MWEFETYMEWIFEKLGRLGLFLSTSRPILRGPSPEARAHRSATLSKTPRNAYCATRRPRIRRLSPAGPRSALEKALEKAVERLRPQPFGMEVQVHGLGGELCRLVRPAGWCLRDLQMAIEEATQVAVSEQRLLLGSEVLEALPDGPLCLTLLRLSPGQVGARVWPEAAEARLQAAAERSEPLAPLLAL